MSSFWESLKDTAESLGGAVYAPYGALIDLATTPFDDKDDNFGTVAAKLAGRASDLGDPFFNEDTWSGYAFGKTMQGIEHVYREEISEPTSALLTMAGHVASDPAGNADDLFSANKWAEAYETAQTRSVGQSATLLTKAVDDGIAGLLGNPTGAIEFGPDGKAIAPADAPPARSPMDERAWRQYKERDPLAASLSSGMVDFAMRWYLDPGIIVGKGAAAVRASAKTKLLTPQDRANLFDKMQSEKAAKIAGIPYFKFKQTGIATRTEKYLEWVNTADGGKPLNAAQIHIGSPELARSAEGRSIASLLADAAKLPKPELARDAQRRILAVAGGDVRQIDRLRDEISEAEELVDTVRNVAKGNTLDLKVSALSKSAQTNPVLLGDLERQLANMNKADDIDKFVRGHQAKLSSLLAVRDTLTHLPGTSAQGRRAVARSENRGLFRSGEMASGLTKVDTAANKVLTPSKAAVERAKAFADVEATSTIWQKGVHQVPLRVIQTAGFVASPWTKAPIKISDALRTAHFAGVANLHDWDGSTVQLDSMMRVSGVAPGARMKALSEAYLARSEPDKQRIIERIENLSMKTLAEQHSAKLGKEIDRDYIEQLMMEGAAGRTSRLTSLQGRAYAATKLSERDLATRGQGIENAQDAATGAASRGKFSRRDDESAEWKLRVDQIDDDGVPVALPLLETQLANTVPLIDVNLARKVLDREGSHIATLSRAWRDDSRELKRLSALKAAGADTLDAAIKARRDSMDWLVEAGQKTMRMWKFSVLFRLGYPMRVVMDDHMRIWTQINAMTFYGDNGTEAASNLVWNQFGRRAAARQELRNAKVRRRELLDQLDLPDTAAYAERAAELATLNRSISGLRSGITRHREELKVAQEKRTLGLDPAVDTGVLKAKIKEREALLREKEGAREHLQEVIGDDPEELRRMVADLEAQIDVGSKALRAEKKTVGTRDIDLGDDIVVDAAFGGPTGKAWREATSSNGAFDANLHGSESRTFEQAARGSFRVIRPDDAGHIDAWADTVNYQFRQSEVAMFFMRGKGDVNDFTRWLREPEQRHLRDRLPHFAADPEDWGNRVYQLVHDYLPTDELRREAVAGKVSARVLRKKFPDINDRPAVHGAVVGDNLGNSRGQMLVGNTMNRLYKFIGEMPTDRLSRHPFFASLYKQELLELANSKKLQYRELGRKFTQEDADELVPIARKRALNHLNRTLFNITAHSNAAHVMRFVSPFFAAHQESLARWWRIAADDPSVIRRFQQGFDLPRKLELVIDENGEPVKSGETISSEHKLLMQVPKAWGGPDVKGADAVHSKWQVNENSFNLILQGGLMNPGTGPLVQFPLEYLANRYANEKEIAKVARVLNPYTPSTPSDVLWPATAKRMVALVQGDGNREYNYRFNQNLTDLTVDFKMKHNREPNRNEAQNLMVTAGRETNVDLFLRVLSNAGSPAPPTPSSKYSAVAHGWDKIYEQSLAEGHSFEWARDRFKEKYSAAYLPMIASNSNNPAGIDISSESVGVYKRNKRLLKTLDPALHRMVLGVDGKGEWSPEARAFFSNETMSPGSPDTYLSNDDPRAAQAEQMERRGWDKYTALTSGLNVIAEEYGLTHYTESDYLMDIKRRAVDVLEEQNWAWADAFNTFSANEYDKYLTDMQQIANNKVLNSDPLRTDVRTLQTYLKIRKVFENELARRKAAGLPSTPEAQANAELMGKFTSAVNLLVKNDTTFEEFHFNGLIERDPYLVGVK